MEVERVWELLCEQTAVQLESYCHVHAWQLSYSRTAMCAQEISHVVSSQLASFDFAQVRKFLVQLEILMLL